MVIITGASRGIGKYLFESFIKDNKDVIGTYNKTDPGEFHRGNFYKMDISDEKNIDKFIKDQRDNLLHIILINCAGININAIAHKITLEEWESVLNINLTGTFLIIKKLLPIMREEKFGRIINFSSVVPQKGVPGTVAYSASKSGLWGMTKAIASENATRNITINTLNLGYFNIGMIQEVPDDLKQIILEQIPMKRFGDPINILNAVNFLIESPYITGQCININGGIY